MRDGDVVLLAVGLVAVGVAVLWGEGRKRSRSSGGEREDEGGDERWWSDGWWCREEDDVVLFRVLAVEE